MALLTHEDIQSALNIDLSDPNGQYLANALIAAAQSLFSGPLYLSFPMEAAQVTEYHDGGLSRYWLNTTAPVSDLTASSRDRSTNTYDTIDASCVVNHGDREVYLTTHVSEAFHALRLTYTTGWTAEILPDDLKQALIETVGIKLLEVANFSSAAPGTSSEEGEEETPATTGALKKVVSLGYTEEFSDAEAQAYWKAKTSQLTRSIGDNLPPSITDVVRSYRPSFAI